MFACLYLRCWGPDPSGIELCLKVFAEYSSVIMSTLFDSFSPLAAHGGQSIEVNKYTLDFGLVDPNQAVTKYLVITNRAYGPVPVTFSRGSMPDGDEYH